MMAHSLYLFLWTDDQPLRRGAVPKEGVLSVQGRAHSIPYRRSIACPFGRALRGHLSFKEPDHGMCGRTRLEGDDLLSAAPRGVAAEAVDSGGYPQIARRELYHHETQAQWRGHDADCH